MSLIGVFFIAATFQLSFEVLLPGPCPNALPTNRISATPTVYEVIGKVPYSAHFDSYLFGSRLGESCRLLIKPPKIQATETISLIDCPYIAGLIEDSRENSQSFVANFHWLIYRSEPVGVKVEEHLRIWYTEVGAFLWSCKEVPAENSHDEGLLVLSDYSLKRTIADIEAELRANISQFVLQPLEETVQWGKEKFCKRDYCMKPIMSIRGSDTSKRIWRIGQIVLLLVLVAVVLKLFCLFYQVKINRVGVSTVI